MGHWPWFLPPRCGAGVASSAPRPFFFGPVWLAPWARDFGGCDLCIHSTFFCARYEVILYIDRFIHIIYVRIVCIIYIYMRASIMIFTETVLFSRPWFQERHVLLSLPRMKVLRVHHGAKCRQVGFALLLKLLSQR